ncbi:MAG: YebC/PmpR family DNA-binding transcriptional regulator [Candidatus Magasanikbacteria bacterium]|nr:YebC/PmpR family DNA-binding transcriptional regulator [Candidatus Magasanikbacteria bacterium]
MSGHSKWHNIQVRKGKQDKKRSATFTKLAQFITIAAQNGTDPEMNFSLRLATEKARQANMPKENIERAIKKGAGELGDGVQLDELTYEGFGPGGVAIMIDVVTDNKNRSVGDVKNIAGKKGGTIGAPGSVQWQFDRRGVTRVESEEIHKYEKDRENIELSLMDAGALDIVWDENGLEIISTIEDLKKITSALQAVQISIEESGLEWVAKEKIEIDEEVGEKLGNLIEALEEYDDVRAVYTNAQ